MHLLDNVRLIGSEILSPPTAGTLERSSTTVVFDDLAMCVQKADAFHLTNHIALMWQSCTEHVIKLPASRSVGYKVQVRRL